MRRPRGGFERRGHADRPQAPARDAAPPTAACHRGRCEARASGSVRNRRTPRRAAWPVTAVHARPLGDPRRFPGRPALLRPSRASASRRRRRPRTAREPGTGKMPRPAQRPRPSKAGVVRPSSPLAEIRVDSSLELRTGYAQGGTDAQQRTERTEKEETERRSPATPAARRSGLDAFCHARLLREGAQTPVDPEMLSSAIGRPDTPRRSVKSPGLTNPGSRKPSSRSRRSKTISRPRSRPRSPAKRPHVRPEQLDHGQKIETRLSPRRQAVGQWQLEPHRRWRESRKWQLFRSPCVTLHIAASPTLRSLYSGRREAQQDGTAHT